MPAVKSKEQEEKRWQMPHIPHGTNMVWALHPPQPRPLLGTEQSTCSTPKGQFPWKGGRGKRNTVHIHGITTAVAVRALSLF